MKNFLKNSLTIIAEIIVLILASIWYYNNKEIEPLIAVVLSTVALISSGISYLTKIDVNQSNTKIGKPKESILYQDFLYNYVPGEMTMSRIFEDLGQPIAKIKDFVERDWKNKKKFKFFVYKYKFHNAVVLFTTELKNDNVISVSLISKGDKMNPIRCRYSYAEDDKLFGEALITEKIIDNSTEFENQNYASWNYSAITARYADYRPIRDLAFTYFIYNLYENKTEMKGQKIDGICITTMSDVKPIIHFNDYLFG